MLERGAVRLQLALVAAMLLGGVAGIAMLPSDARVPIHFNAGGEVDGWAGASFGLLLMPATAVLVILLQHALPHIEPRQRNLLASHRAYTVTFVAITLLLAVLQAYIVAVALGWSHPLARLPMGLVGGLLVVVGNMFGKVRPNYSFGIRTPWTLADDDVWERTHRFGGKAFVLAGGVLLLLSFSPLPAVWQAPAILMATLGAALAAVAKSYLLWRRLRPKGGKVEGSRE